MRWFPVAVFIFLKSAIAFAGPTETITHNIDEIGQYLLQAAKPIIKGFVQLSLIGTTGWILSLITFDRKTETMIKILTVLCVINMLVQSFF